MSSPAEWPPACTPYNPNYPSQYGYRPNLALSISFTVIFGSICVAHAFQAWRYRTIWMMFFVIGSGLECLGWIARSAGHACSYSRTLFTMQTAVLIMGTSCHFHTVPPKQLGNLSLTHQNRTSLDTSWDLHYFVGRDCALGSPCFPSTPPDISPHLRLR